MVWSAPDKKHAYCYACNIESLEGFSMKSRKFVNYPAKENTNSVKPKWKADMRKKSVNQIEPMDISKSSLTPIRASSPLQEMMSFISTISSSTDSNNTQSSGEMFQPNDSTKIFVPIKQNKLEDMAKRLKLTLTQTELLGSMLREINSLDPSTKTTFLRNDKTYSENFEETNVEWSDKYQNVNWHPRPDWGEYNHSDFCAKDAPLIPRDKILFPPLHIKLGLVNQFFSTVYKLNEAAQEHVQRLLPKLSSGKHKLGVYDGLQIRKIFKDKDLPSVLSDDQGQAFYYLKMKNFQETEKTLFCHLSYQHKICPT
uniref:CSON014228 protein n=1 Tax=Culicoides sonorensis TaxID=179676 RepID=A0A336K5Y9_CULSO